MSSLSTEDFLTHNGVKGMKWGVVKKEDSLSGWLASTTPELALKKKFSTGDAVAIYRDPPGKLVKFIARRSKKYAEDAQNLHSFTFKDKDGTKVGDAQFVREPGDSLYLVWLGIKPAHRGKGYASASMKGVVEYAKTNNIKQLRLEVPGNAPDARHIYSKLGFKFEGAEGKDYINDPKDPVFGGLYNMTYDVNQVKHAADNLVGDDWEEQFASEFAQFLIENVPLEAGAMVQSENTDQFLAHFGVKGMKWGVRKDGTLSGHTSVHTAHEDAVKAQAAKEKVRVGGVKALSNEELQALVTRQNLEQNFARLNPAKVSAGKNFATTVATIGQNSVKNTSQRLADQAVKSVADAAVKGLTKAAKSAAKEGVKKMTGS